MKEKRERGEGGREERERGSLRKRFFFGVLILVCQCRFVGNFMLKCSFMQTKVNDCDLLLCVFVLH